MVVSGNEIKGSIFSASEIHFGITFGDRGHGDSLETRVFISSPSINGENISFIIFGADERKELEKLFTQLASFVKIHEETNRINQH